MKKYVVWYAFRGMETEGQLRLEEPAEIEASDTHEAMWKYRIKIKWPLSDFYENLEDYRNTDPSVEGWGFYCKELANG